MSAIAYSARALSDLDRLFRFLLPEDPSGARRAAEEIVDAISVLARHPFVGRRVRGDLRELVISRGRTGYVALYRVVPLINRVEVLAIRHQREAGFS